MTAPQHQQPEQLPMAAAIALAERGIPVFPVHTPQRDGSCSCGNPKCDDIGKHPRTPAGLKDATTDLNQIRAWWRKWPRANVAMRTGAESGTFVLDIDPRHGGDYDRLTATYGELPQTLTAITGGAGQHLVFKHPGFRVQNDAKGKVLGDGYDIRGDGGYIIVAPSLHASGNRYAWVDSTAKPAAAPQWLLDRISAAQAASEPKRSTSASQDAPADRHDRARHWLDHYIPLAGNHRNNTGMDLCLQLRDDARLDQAEALAYMLDYASAVGLPEREVSATVRSIYKREPREPARSQVARANPRTYKRQEQDYAASEDAPEPPDYDAGGESPNQPTYNLTELGNAERLIARHGRNLRYCYTWHRWLVYDGRRWAEDTAGHVTRYAQATVRSIYGEAEREEDDKRRAEIVRHAVRSESAKAVRGMLDQAQPHCPIQPDDLDGAASEWLLNCPNGTLDLRTGQLRAHRRDDYLTKLAGAPYDPAAKCPTFLAFVRRIMNGNERLVTFLQRAIGYSLTGSTREQVFFLPYGTGQNGKSTLLDTLAVVFGDYATQAAPATFMVKHNEGVPNDVAMLKGARFVSAVETEDGQRLAESLLKQMTGDKTMTARFMRAEYFQFKPALKLWLATNHKPVIRGTDNGIWRRIRLIPFTVTIPESERDTTLPEKLQAEAAGVLAWAVQGCLDWQREGLTNPPEVQAATAEYRGEMDVLATFIAERCITGPNKRVIGKALYKAYEEWCDESGERAKTKRQFGQLLRERGFSDARGTGNLPTWHGIGLLDTTAPDPDSTNGYHNATADTHEAPASDSYQSDQRYRFSPLSSRGIETRDLYPEIGNESNFGNSEGSTPREQVRSYGERNGWPRLPYAPAKAIPTGEAAWLAFLVGPIDEVRQVLATIATSASSGGAA